MLSPMVRTALFVADLARSLAFYGDVLGLREVYWEGELEGDSLEKLLNVPTGTLCRAVILKSEDLSYGMVGLFELSDPRPEQIDHLPHQARNGGACLVFYYPDLDLIVERAKQGEYSIVCAPIPLVHQGRIKQREMTLTDPDGIMINLIEWDPQRDERPELT